MGLVDEHITADAEIERDPRGERLGTSFAEFNVVMAGRPRAFARNCKGILAAIDMDKGDIAWKIAHGETPDNIRNNPALKGLTIPRTGQPGNIGPLATKTLVIIGDPSVATMPSGERGARRWRFLSNPYICS